MENELTIVFLLVWLKFSGIQKNELYTFFFLFVILERRTLVRVVYDKGSNSKENSQLDNLCEK